MATKRFYRRRFLNRRSFHAGAYVIADCRIESHPHARDGQKHSVEAVLTSADCGHITGLDFTVDRARDVDNALYKARLLRDVVNDFTAALETAVADWRDRQN